MQATTKNTEMVTVECPRCLGFANAFARFGHINNGKCFRCNGARTVQYPAWKFDAATLAHLRAK